MVKSCVESSWLLQSVHFSFETPISLFRFPAGHSVLGINGLPAAGRQLEDGRDILDVIANEDNYPLDIKFGRAPLSTNEKIMRASMFHS